MSEKYLVIVESPTKAKTIRKFLPKNYIVEASMGHVRDLPQSAAEIPEQYKKEAWAKLGVDAGNNFEAIYVVPKGKSKIVSELKRKLKECDGLFLATDEDREGESISWHLVQLLKPKVPIKRMVFHEITKKAIEQALLNTREIDEKLVRAQEARRILDRVFGYTLSPLLWKKISFGLSAGRVQSSGLRLISERERERARFKVSTYWDLKAKLEKDNIAFETKLITFQGKRIAGSKDFDETTGNLKKDSPVLLLGEKEAKDLESKLKGIPFNVQDIQEREVYTEPQAPFITSTLQQEGVRKLGMSTKRVMQVAQKLYEEGFITYMRTDSPNLSTEAISGARNQITSLFGKDYLSKEVRQYKSKSKDAQEAHEAIRPAGSEFKHPEETGLSGPEFQLYELIWKRTLATQMAAAKKMNMTVKFDVGECIFQSYGSRIIFPGFLRVYVEGKDDPEQALEDQEILLPNLKVAEKITSKEVLGLPHETRPPARYTEASLIQKLEKEGIGRPSTYASIIGTILDRGYVHKEGSSLIPSFTGMAVSQLLEKHFPELVDYKFTSEMEEVLDLIASGKKDYLKYLKEFYQGENGLQQRVESRDKSIKPNESRTVELPIPDLGFEVKVGKYGAYVVGITKGEGGEEVHVSLPESLAPADLKKSDIEKLLEVAKKGPTSIGLDPVTKKNIYILNGRFGPYAQLGEVVEEETPKRASIPPGRDPSTVTLEEALQLLALPRELGIDPESKQKILANRGRFGPYVQRGTEYRSLKKTDDVYTVTVDRAIELFKEEKKSRGPKILKDYTEENGGKKTQLLEGMYGPYVKMGAKNFTLPDDLKEKIKKDPKVAFEVKFEVLAPLLGIKSKAVSKKNIPEKPPKTKKAGKGK